MNSVTDQRISSTGFKVLNKVEKADQNRDQELIKAKLAPLHDFLQAEAWKRFMKVVEEVKANPPQWLELVPEIVNLDLFLKEVLKDPAYAGTDIDDLFDAAKKADGTVDESSLFIQVMTAARELERIKPVKEILYPVDIVNSLYFWEILLEDEGDVIFKATTSAKGKEPILYVDIAIEFSKLRADTQTCLTIFDKFVYVAATALYNAGNIEVTPAQIYEVLHPGKKANRKALDKIRASVDKMIYLPIRYDNQPEVNVYGNYEWQRYNGPLLPGKYIDTFESEPGQRKRNEQGRSGRWKGTKVHMYEEPPLAKFARERGQFTTFNKSVFNIPCFYMTDDNMALLDYLITQISRIKNKATKSNQKITFKKILEGSGIDIDSNDRKKRRRIIQKVKQCLDHFTSEGWILGYQIKNESVYVKI